MENSKLKNPKFLSASRTIVKHLLVIIVYIIVKYVFYLYTRDMKHTKTDSLIWETLMFLFIYMNTSYAFNVYNRREYIIYTSREKHPPLYFELLSREFIYDFVCFIITVSLGIFNIYYVLAIPLAIATNIFTYLSPRKKWLKGKGAASKEYTSTRLAGYILFIILEGSLIFLMLFGLLSFASFFFEFFVLIIPYLKYLYILIGLIIFFAYCSSLSKRHKFIRRLKKFAKKHNVTITDMYKPYLSVFYMTSDPNFVIETNGKKYACKLISFTNKISAVVFKNDGFFFRTSLRNIKYSITPTITTERRYGFDYDGGKVLILTSIPLRVLVNEYGKSKDVDTGDCCGEYKIFFPDGFFGAVDRNTIDRKTYN